jgi:hypothetical protein
MNIDEFPTKEELFEASPSGLDLDAINLVTVAYGGLYNANLSGNFDRLKPLETYEAYLRRKDIPIPERAEETIRKSNQVNIKRVNALVAEYNAVLPQIKRDKNAQLGQEILKRLTDVFNGK